MKNFHTMTIHNVTIGDKFRPNNAKHLVAQVIDFYEVKSLSTGDIIRHECVARLLGGTATNSFITPFASVARYKVN